MDWREAAADGLPTPRNDEPASLRQDILDELADHLDCALTRELSKNISPEEAVANVKRRFGDPQDLARRLWLDAMKDAIMSKRLTLATMGFMTVICLMLGWIAWTSQRASQEAAESLRKSNAELVEKLSTLLAARPAPAATPVAERADVHFHLIGDDAQKSPARGYQGKLFLAGSGSSLNPLERTSDAEGNLNFGMLPAGSYVLRVTTPWREFAQIPVEVSPAFPITSPIVCPAQDWQPADVEFEFDGLPAIKDRDALIVLHISGSASRGVPLPEVAPVGASYAWMHDTGPGNFQTSYDVVLDPQGHLIYFSQWTGQNGMSQSIGSLALRWGGGWADNRSGFQTLLPTDQFSWLAQRLGQKPQLGFYDRQYTIGSITVLLAPDIRRMAGQTPEPSHHPFTLLTWERDLTPIAEAVIAAANTEASPLQPVHGRKNVWKVHLSRNFVDQIDRMLLSSASHLPDAKDEAQKRVDSAAGAELLKTLGIASAAPERTASGLTGLRLGAIADNLPAKYAGLHEGDLLLGVNGWNVNDNRDLGAASRGYAIAPVKYPRAVPVPGYDAPVPSNALVALVSRDSKTQPNGTMLFEIKPPGSPAPDVHSPQKDQTATKMGGGGFAGRRQRANP
jgi:hypothetical protein